MQASDVLRGANRQSNFVNAASSGRHFAADLNRLERLSRAVEDAKRAGSVAISFVDNLTDAGLVAKAEAMEKQATAALAAVK